MNNRRYLLIVAAVLTVLTTAALLPKQAQAQFDHLTCFKVKDSRKFKALVNLDMLQDQFDALGACKVTGKAKLFCVPTAKSVQEFTIGKSPGVLTDLAGPEPIPDRICYKVKCPKQTIASEIATDQFGTGTLEKFKAQFLCTPAVKGVPPTTTSTVVTCIDLDFDTYGDSCPNGPDCDDSDPAIHPGAIEQCNGIDDNCDGQTDENLGGAPCSTGSGGPCDAGIEVCNGVSIVCQGPPPQTEICNGIDDDCDGVTDEATCPFSFLCDGIGCVCPSGQVDCSGVCVDLSTDVNNCGVCGSPCSNGQVCVNGTCQ